MTAGVLYEPSTQAQRIALVTANAWRLPRPLLIRPRPPMPVDRLPEPMAHFVKCVKSSSQTLGELAGMLVVAVAAIPLAKRIQVKITDDWIEPVQLFVVVEMESGAGDVTVWGPNPLYDEANAVDTGALTHGSCTSLNTAGDNHCTETVLFADGSTLEIQGIQRGSGEPSPTTIVGGSGEYRGATGTVVVDPSADYRTWTKTFEVVMPASNPFDESSGAPVSRAAQQPEVVKRRT